MPVSRYRSRMSDSRNEISIFGGCKLALLGYDEIKWSLDVQRIFHVRQSARLRNGVVIGYEIRYIHAEQPFWGSAVLQCIASLVTGYYMRVVAVQRMPRVTERLRSRIYGCPVDPKARSGVLRASTPRRWRVKGESGGHRNKLTELDRIAGDLCVRSHEAFQVDFKA